MPLQGKLLEALDKLSARIDKLDDLSREDNNVAILWDVENVTPDTDSLFIEGFLEYVLQFGRLTVAQAFADWTRSSVKKLAAPLSDHHFELIHIPKARKNSADMSLVTHGIELALKYPDLGAFILVTGDSDFRPLILSLRRSGKRVHIVCNVQTASEDLLILADSFKDFRELRPGGTTIGDSELELEEARQEDLVIEPQPTLTTDEVLSDEKKDKIREQQQRAFDLLAEAVELMKKDGVKPGMGPVKIRLKMLNPNFDEGKLGFKSWSSFVNAAVTAGCVQVKGKDERVILDSIQKAGIEDLSDQEKVFELLIKILRELDKSTKARFHDFAQVGEALYKLPGFQDLWEKLGYKKLKEFIQAAEVRKLVETQVEGLVHSVRRIQKT